MLAAGALQQKLLADLDTVRAAAEKAVAAAEAAAEADAETVAAAAGAATATVEGGGGGPPVGKGGGGSAAGGNSDGGGGRGGGAPRRLTAVASEVDVPSMLRRRSSVLGSFIGRRSRWVVIWEGASLMLQHAAQGASACGDLWLLLVDPQRNSSDSPNQTRLNPQAGLPV